MNWKTHNKVVDYLRDNFYTTDFINNHTRKQLAEMLRIINPSEGKDLYVLKWLLQMSVRKKSV